VSYCAGWSCGRSARAWAGPTSMNSAILVALQCEVGKIKRPDAVISHLMISIALRMILPDSGCAYRNDGIASGS
jgi:hypothetical protein